MLNKKRIAALMLAAMTAFSLIGCGSTGPSAEVVSKIELGAEYLGNGEYEEAIEAYEEAIALDKYAWDAHAGLIVAMAEAERPQEEIQVKVTEALEASLEKAESGIEENEVEVLAELYDTAIEAVGENDVLVLDVLITSNDVLAEENPLQEEYVAKLEEMANYYIEGNNYEAAQELIDRLNEEGKTELVEELQKALDDKKLAEEAYVQALIEASEYIIAGDWAGLANFCDSEEMAVLDEKLGDVGYVSYAFNDAEHGGNVIAYYSMEGCNCNQWYYGQMKDGVRTGHGGWYWAMNNANGELYVDNFIGEWSNDAPNGYGTRKVELAGEIIKDTSGTYVNGLLDGTYTKTDIDEDGYEWEVTYTVENGRYVEVEVEDWIKLEEGYYVYAVAYRDEENGSRTAHVYKATYDDIERVAHFGE